jgi:hypothetical protein
MSLQPLTFASLASVTLTPGFGNIRRKVTSESLLERRSHPVWVSAECIGGCLMNSSMLLSAAWVALQEGFVFCLDRLRFPSANLAFTQDYGARNGVGDDIRTAVKDRYRSHLKRINLLSEITIRFLELLKICMDYEGNCLEEDRLPMICGGDACMHYLNTRGEIRYFKTNSAAGPKIK